MANHCIDVICLTCGRQWCARGCNYSNDTPNQAAIDRYLKQKREWCNRWGYSFTLGTKLDDEVCNCGSKEVYMD